MTERQRFKDNLETRQKIIEVLKFYLSPPHQGNRGNLFLFKSYYSRPLPRIAILRKIRACLPLKQRLQFYNSIIRPVMSYANVVWANCDKESVYRVLRLQKRAARVISYADRMTPSVALFNKLGWIPFYEQHKIDKCIIMYKRINGYLPNYLNEHLILNNKRHSRNTRYSSINAVCPKYRRETEGGRSFAVSATRLWNSTPIEIRKLDSVACFKKNMFAKIFKEQQCLHHFII